MALGASGKDDVEITLPLESTFATAMLDCESEPTTKLLPCPSAVMHQGLKLTLESVDCRALAIATEKGVHRDGSLYLEDRETGSVDFLEGREPVAPAVHQTPSLA